MHKSKLLFCSKLFSIMLTVALTVSIILLLASCISNLNEKKQIPTPPITSAPTTQPTATSLPLTQSPTSDVIVNASHINKLFAPIINAYSELEKSGYTSFNKDIIGDSLLAIAKGNTYNFGWNEKPILLYSFCDINSDGVQELLIGANNSIAGIYVLQNKTPVSIIQVEDRHNLNLLMYSDDNCIIEDGWGHMGVATEFYYRIDKNGKLVTLNKLYTNGDIKNDDGLIGHNRAKDVDGKQVSITENEYCSLIRKYGATGYEPFEETSKEDKIVNVVWKPISTYRQQLNNTP